MKEDPGWITAHHDDDDPWTYAIDGYDGENADAFDEENR